ncbi:MAG: ABC transporter ATP-binding protein [Actinobacteria bacterium]|nr:ABC transporter ATP-binding protein [Actinomycetota bacterium]
MTTVVATSSLRKRYRRSDPWAVDGVDLRIEEGQVFGLLGPNGAGKTSIVKMVAGLLRPDAGSVEVLGSRPGDRETRRAIGFAPEDPDFPKFLRAGEVLEYFGQLLGISAAERSRRIPETLQWCGLADEKRQVRHFSKGMKQRLGLGQAILGRPRLLILDEPTADLDPIGRRDVRELIEGVKARGGTVLLNSHLLSEVERVSDTVAVLNRGRVLAEGPISEVVPEGRTLEQVFMDLVDQSVGGPRDRSVPSFMSEERPT